MTQEITRDWIPEAEPAFGFQARPADGAAAARRGQHNLPVEQRDHVPGRDGADDKGGAGPRDRGVAGCDAVERVVVIREVSGDGFGGCGGHADGGVVGLWDGFGVDFVEGHDGGMLG